MDFLGDSGADHTFKIATDFGTIGVGNAGDAANAVDDITPTAFEEANGSGSGTYSVDVGSGMDGSMSVSYANGDLFGTGISLLVATTQDLTALQTMKKVLQQLQTQKQVQLNQLILEFHYQVYQ